MGDQNLAMSSVNSNLIELGTNANNREFALDKLEKIADISDNGKTFYHTLNVADSSREIAKFYGMDERFFYELGLLHDVGKTMVDKNVISYNGIFGEPQFNEMKKHVYFSREILRSYDLFLADAAFLHHATQEINPYPDIDRYTFSWERGYKLLEAVTLLHIADSWDARMRRKDGRNSENNYEQNLRAYTSSHTRNSEIVDNLIRVRVLHVA